MEREFHEEVGCKIINIGKMIGLTKEIGPDKFNSNAYFGITNHYYMCKVDVENLNVQKLDSMKQRLK